MYVVISLDELTQVKEAGMVSFFITLVMVVKLRHGLIDFLLETKKSMFYIQLRKSWV